MASRAPLASAVLSGMLCLPSLGVAQGRPAVPSALIAHVQGLDAACRAKGGTPGGGRFIANQDFNGDGRADFLVSEADYICTGRPDALKSAGGAKLAIFVTDAAGQASRAYYETVSAHQATAGRPARVQVMKTGAFCAPGAAPQIRCSADLMWNGKAFVQSNFKVVQAANPPAAAPQASTSVPAANMSDEARASLPSADVLLAVLPSVGQKPTLASVKQQASGVRWAASAQAPYLASGTLGALETAVEGAGGAPRAVWVAWSKIGAMIPYDVVGALRQRGAQLTQVACEKTGAGEGERIYAGSAPGKAPFTLTIYQREAPTAGAFSRYSATVGLDGRTPPRGSMVGCDF